VELVEKGVKRGLIETHQFLFIRPVNEEKTYKHLSSLDRSGFIIDLWNGNNGHGFIGSVRDAVKINPGLYTYDECFRAAKHNNVVITNPNL